MVVSLLFTQSIFLTYSFYFCQNLHNCYTIYYMTRVGFEHHRMDMEELTVTACLVPPMHYTPFISFITTFAEMLSRKCTCHGINHVVMTCYIIIN
jgi:hypothetical protein